MLDFHAASDRAVRYALKTGYVPNMYVIHAWQRNEGHEPCFARAVERCQRPDCRWFRQCMALRDFDTGNRSRPQTTPHLPVLHRQSESVTSAEQSARRAETPLRERKPSW